MNILSDNHVQFIHKHMAFDYKYVCEKNAAFTSATKFSFVSYMKIGEQS